MSASAENPKVENTDQLGSTRVVAIAVDGSKYSEYAFNWAVANIIRPKTDQIILLNCRPLVTVRGSGKIDETNTNESAELLRSFSNKIPASKYNVRAIALCGDPRSEIPVKVEELNADMLVVGSRGLGGVKKVLMGSVSDYLVRHLKIPVVIPRADSE
ncbi:hypothetical protein HDU83_002221 [Entophlyctis luteolus]|nr:hypothetical protein HDU83_002221 [Entophlyctis luteolus]